MSAKRYEITQVQHVQEHQLRITYADGMVQVLDFAPWLNSPRRTSYDKRYRAIAWFKRVKNDGYALVWGDHQIGMYAEDLRKGLIKGVATVSTQAAA